MPWVKLDDGFLTNPKVLAAGKDGRALIIAGLLFCARELTNGLIVDGAAPLIAGGADVKLKPTAARLVELGVWHRENHTCPRCAPCPTGHYLVHDYLDWQPSAEDELAKRKAISEKRAAAGRKGAAARWGSNGHGSDSSSHADAMANEWQTDDEPSQTDGNEMAPSPSPVPPLAVTGLPVRSTAYAEPPDDDDPIRRKVAALAAALGQQDHERRVAEVPDDPLRDPAAHLRKCVRSRRENPALDALIRRHPDATLEQLLELADGPRLAEPTPEPPAIDTAACPDCHGSNLVELGPDLHRRCDHERLLEAS